MDHAAEGEGDGGVGSGCAEDGQAEPFRRLRWRAGFAVHGCLRAAREGSIGLSLGLVPHADIGVGPRVEGGGIGDRVGGLVEGGGEDPEFDALFTVDRPAIFAYHGYPTLIHRLTYRRHGHDNLHVRGYKEEGTTTTPFDMVMLNDLDRFHLVMDVIDRVPGLLAAAGHLRQLMVDKRITSRAYPRDGEDAPEIRDWKWPY